MKRLFVILFALLPMLLNAGVIMKRSGERLEDVSIKSVTDTKIIYVDQNGTETTIPKSEVSAILYDNGRYEEIKSHAVTSMNKTQSAVATSEAYNPPVEVGPGAKEYNVCAYGVYAMLYVPNSKYDGTVVEYRVIYKGQNETPEFKYLGTTPFAYLTEKMYNNNFTAKGDPNFQKLKELNPFVIENAKDVKKVEFRLSLDSYKTVIVKPVYDAFVGGGPVMFIPLQNLKPLKEDETNEVPVAKIKEEKTPSSNAEVVVPVESYIEYQNTETNEIPTAQIKEEKTPSSNAEVVAPVEPYIEHQNTETNETPAAQMKKKKTLSSNAEVVVPIEPYIEHQNTKINETPATQIEEEKTLSSNTKVEIPIEEPYTQHHDNRTQSDRQSLESNQLFAKKNQNLTATPQENELITRISYDEYKLGDKWMTRKDYYEFINNHDRCVPAYTQFKKGKTLQIAGWVCLGIGGGVSIGIGVLAGVYDEPILCLAGLLPAAVGTCALSIPLLTVGAHKKNYAFEKYNKYCAKPAVSLNLQGSQNGIGLALNF